MLTSTRNYRKYFPKYWYRELIEHQTQEVISEYQEMGLHENKVSTKSKEAISRANKYPTEWGKSFPDIFHTESEYPGFTNNCRN